jgi:transcriptional antiterminator Rof (Rho-off)
VETYQPINCEFHDAIETYATRRETVDIVVEDPAEDSRSIRTVVCDVYSRNGEEFLLTDAGERIRLDKVKSIGSYDVASFG